jgi:DNA-binding NarL/FixJ family response regulator
MEKTSSKTIVIADDHNVIRHSLKLFLETQRDFSVVGEAANGIEALQLVEKWKPDVLVLDLAMPVLNGLEVLRQFARCSSKTRVIVLSMHANEGYVLEALQRGAVGYVLKQSTAANLIDAVRDVLAGRRYLSPPLSERAIEAYMQKSLSHDNPVTGASSLTLREAEVLGLVGEGHTNAEIARHLGISPRTVEHFRSRLMKKLRCRSQADLIRRAIVHAEASLRE